MRRLLLAAALPLLLVALAAPVAHARPASEIAAVALHPWQLRDASTRERVFDGIAATGARWVRVDMPWSWVEPNGPVLADGHGHWSALDAIVHSADARGIKVIGIVAYTPRWASDSGELWAYPDREPFETYFRALLRRYPQVPAWELWNEPNLERFSKPRPDPAGFVDLLRSARRARDEVGSRAKLISGGIAPGGDIDVDSWLAQVAIRGGLKLVDGLGFHPYSSVAPDDPRSWMMRLEALHERLGELGSPDLPLWLTEYGAPSSPFASGYAPPLSELQQADRLRVVYSLASRFDWIANLTWFEYRDSETGSDDPEYNFGLVRTDLTPKPALAAFREVVAGAQARLQSRLTLASRYSQARVRVVKTVRAARSRDGKRPRLRKRRVVKRRLVRRIAVTGRLKLPGTPWPMTGITALLPRRNLPPRVVRIPVLEGYFWARFEGPALTSGQVEVRYDGSSTYLPVVARSQVATSAITRR